MNGDKLKSTPEQGKEAVKIPESFGNLKERFDSLNKKFDDLKNRDRTLYDDISKRHMELQGLENKIKEGKLNKEDEEGFREIKDTLANLESLLNLQMQKIESRAEIMEDLDSVLGVDSGQKAVVGEKKLDKKENKSEREKLLADIEGKRKDDEEECVEIKPEDMEEIMEAEEKKGFWSKVKGVFKKEKREEEKEIDASLGVLATTTGYKTTARVLGVKTLTDLAAASPLLFEKLGWFGADASQAHGDIADYIKNKQKIKEEKEGITEAFGDGDFDKVAELINNSKNIDNKEKEEFLNKLNELQQEYQGQLDILEEEKNKELNKVFEIYLKNKISRLELTKDFLNTSLTAAGLPVLRLGVYAGTALTQLTRKGLRERKKKEETSYESYVSEVAKVYAQSAKDTVHGLTLGVLDSEKKTKKERAVGMVKSFGTVLTGLGLGGVAFSAHMDTNGFLDRLESGFEDFEDKGLVGGVIKHYEQNCDRLMSVPGRLVGLVDKVMGGEDVPVATSGVGENKEESAVRQESKITDVPKQPEITSADNLDPEKVIPPLVVLEKISKLDKIIDDLLEQKGKVDEGARDQLLAMKEQYLAEHPGDIDGAIEHFKSLVGYREGISHSLSRQLQDRLLEADAKQEDLTGYGFKGSIKSPEDVAKWANNEAGKIVRAKGLYGKDFDMQVQGAYETKIDLKGDPGNWGMEIVDGEDNLATKIISHDLSKADKIKAKNLSYILDLQTAVFKTDGRGIEQMINDMGLGKKEVERQKIIDKFVSNWKRGQISAEDTLKSGLVNGRPWSRISKDVHNWLPQSSWLDKHDSLLEKNSPDSNLKSFREVVEKDLRDQAALAGFESTGSIFEMKDLDGLDKALEVVEDPTGEAKVNYHNLAFALESSNKALQYLESDLKKEFSTLFLKGEWPKDKIDSWLAEEVEKNNVGLDVIKSKIREAIVDNKAIDSKILDDLEKTGLKPKNFSQILSQDSVIQDNDRNYALFNTTSKYLKSLKSNFLNRFVRGIED